MKIRPAHEDDLSALTDIFNQAITQTTTTRYEKPFSAEERRDWWRTHEDPRYPVLVGEDAGMIIGYASFSAWLDGPAYEQTAEAGIFLHLEQRGRGHGTQLLRALLAEARARGLHAIVARVWASNAASLALCRRCGFERVGVQREAGWVRGAWEDCVILEYLVPGE